MWDCSDRQGWALFIGTPHGVNLFSRLFYEGQQKADWYSARYTVYDTDALPEAERARPELRFARARAALATGDAARDRGTKI